jgi:hypothetical protein
MEGEDNKECLIANTNYLPQKKQTKYKAKTLYKHTKASFIAS